MGSDIRVRRSLSDTMRLLPIRAAHAAGFMDDICKDSTLLRRYTTIHSSISNFIDANVQYRGTLIEKEIVDKIEGR